MWVSVRRKKWGEMVVILNQYPYLILFSILCLFLIDCCAILSAFLFHSLFVFLYGCDSFFMELVLIRAF